MTVQEFKKTYAIRLNQQQEVAACQVAGPVLLLAVPGSGKTTVIVTRLGYMVYCCGIDPKSILTVTYTVAATKDMQCRYTALFGEEYAGALSFRTINSVCYGIIDYYARVKRRMKFDMLQGEAQGNKIIRDLFVASGADYPTDLAIKEVKTKITYCKNMMCTEDEIEAIQMDGISFAAIYRAYQSYLRDHRRMDFDDQMVIAYQVLRKHPDILGQFQNRYRYINVDEAQDTSRIQHAILALLASGHRNMFMVGDEDQSIYGFRAAYPQALLQFEKTYPGAKVLLMETNYRSTCTIVARADAFIQQNQSRHPKHMRTENGPGEEIRKIVLADYSHQYNYLAKVAEGCVQETAILYRNNESALPLIDLLEQKGIPYTCRQRESSFFSSPMVRDVTDMLTFAFEDCNRALFLRFYPKLNLKIKRDFLTDLLRYQEEGTTVLDTLLESGKLEGWQVGRLKALRTHFSKLPTLNSFVALQRLVKFMGFGEYLADQHADLTKLNILLALANQNCDTARFLLRLEELRQVLEKDAEPEHSPFKLSTIHSSKGLEYERVILIDVMDGVFPNTSPAGGTKGPSEEEVALLEEERRLFYVGVTRAKRQVDILSYTNRFGDPTGTFSTFTAQLRGETPEVPSFQDTSGRSPTASEVSNWEKDYIPGTYVTHKKFGQGVLQSKNGTIATIGFLDGSIKKLDLQACLKKGLIQRTSLV